MCARADVCACARAFVEYNSVSEAAETHTHTRTSRSQCATYHGKHVHVAEEDKELDVDADDQVNGEAQVEHGREGRGRIAPSKLVEDVLEVDATGERLGSGEQGIATGRVGKVCGAKRKE